MSQDHVVRAAGPGGVREGIVRLLTVRGQMTSRPTTRFAADASALADDWRTVRQDLLTAHRAGEKNPDESTGSDSRSSRQNAGLISSNTAGQATVSTKASDSDELAELARYGEVSPELSERIIEMVERQQTHRITMELEAIRSQHRRSWVGLLGGWASVTMGLLLGAWVIAAGHAMAGAVMATATVAGLTSVYFFETSSPDRPGGARQVSWRNRWRLGRYRQSSPPEGGSDGGRSGLVVVPD